jgi:methylmalonyl-CoA/ethylmalonyl-CoA epimerase
VSETAGPHATQVLGHPISHISYVVADLATAVDLWVATFGAGPFFLLEHIDFDRVEHGGAPAVFDHSAAFGQWGSIAVELQQIHEVKPARTLGPLLYGRGTAPNHVAYIAPDPESESARLERLGLPKFLFATFGPVEITFHDVPMLGHAIEIHRQCDFIENFFASLAAAADGWDGSDPLRAMGGDG